VLFNTPLVIPRRITQKLLELPGRSGNFLGNIFHVFSLNGHHQALQIFHAPFSALGTTKETLKPLVKSIQLGHKFYQIALRHGAPPAVFQEDTP
jgi:hypothetical protein